jgi:hypothetical protein
MRAIGRVCTATSDGRATRTTRTKSARTMSHSRIYRLLPVLLLINEIGCRDAKSRSQQAGADTAASSTAASIDRRDTPTVLTRAEVTRGGGPTNTDDRSDAADVVRRYYRAIQDGQYDSAYELWSGSGIASGQTRAEFATGFSHTVQTRVTIGDGITVEAAAGSQYVTVPVTIEAVLESGARQNFGGIYILRRAMVDGATPEQRRWHIFQAHLQPR